MTTFDYVVLAILGLSIIVSVWRGAVREILALASWVIAFLAAQGFASTVAAYLPAALSNPALRLFVGFVTVFVLVFLVSSFAAVTLAKLVRAVGLGPVDRTLGAIFGLLRGILVVVTLVLLGGLTAAPRLPEWRDAMLSPPLEAAASEVKWFLPADLSRRISYE